MQPAAILATGAIVSVVLLLVGFPSEVAADEGGQGADAGDDNAD
jgi:hypothetical protein